MNNILYSKFNKEKIKTALGASTAPKDDEIELSGITA